MYNHKKIKIQHEYKYCFSFRWQYLEGGKVFGKITRKRTLYETPNQLKTL